MQDADWPQGFERVADSEAEPACMRLQGLGFDPVVIDGLDPAAYVWALFEMRERLAGCDEAIRLRQHPVSEPRCLTIVPEPPARQRLPRATAHRPAPEPVAAGG